MSQGKIKKPRHSETLPSLNRPLNEVIYQLLESCEVVVEDSEWQKGDAQLQLKMRSLNQDLESVQGKIGHFEGSLEQELQKLKKEMQELKSHKPLLLEVSVNRSPAIDVGLSHYQLPPLLKALSTRSNVYLAGPAGSGKTHAAEQCAKALGVNFHFTGAVASEFKLTGFIDAQGRIVNTEFRRAFEHGGLFLFDEIDASYPQAVLAFNAALANNYMDFPDKRVNRHENFYCIAAANTYGQGADRQYVGRSQLDAASLDRFVFIDWKYDEKLEFELAGNPEWTALVQKVRKFVEEQKIRHVVSTRASIMGAKLLAAGLEKREVMQMLLWKGMDESVKAKIKSSLQCSEKLTSPGAADFRPQFQKNALVKKGSVIGRLHKFLNNRAYCPQGEPVLSPVDGRIVQLREGYVSQGAVLAEIKEEWS